jgi:hypothetical protein
MSIIRFQTPALATPAPALQPRTGFEPRIDVRSTFRE